MHYLKLIRWTNLLIIFFTQLLVWACVILPIQKNGNNFQFTYLENFLCISVSTVLIAAAGYIINDYFDIRIDNINRPEKMILEKRIPRRLAIILHSALNITALLLAAIVAQRAGRYSWLLLQLCCTILLWFYSTHFKRRFMIGNVVVAFLTAFTIVVLILYVPAMHFYLTQPGFINLSETSVIPNPVWVLAIYIYFAFVLTWMREIVKDMEDFKGDEAEGCITMPIKWGLKKAEKFTQLLGVFALIPLLIVGVNLLMKKNIALGIYTFLALIFPIIAWLVYLPKAATTKHYSKVSRYLKIIMVAGIGSLIIYYLQANA